MLVSGGKVIAIDSIKKGNTNKDTLSGDGVWTNLGVNTDVIATTKKLDDTKSELESKINSASSALSGEIKKKQDELKFELNEFDKITAIGPKNGSTTALAGGSNVVVSAGANTRVDSATSGEQTIYTVNVTANPTNVTVSGENGLTARRDEGTSAYYLGLNNNYIKAITSVSSKLDQTAFNSYTATADAIAYSAANNYIKISAHKISGYDWTNTITAASSNAVTTVGNKFNGNGNSYSGYDGKPFIDNTTPKWSVVGDGNRISVTSADNKYGVSWNSAGFATEQWVLGKNYLPKDIASSTYLTIASAEDIYQKKLRAGSGIVIEDDTVSVEIYVSGDLTPYSAGEGIGIDNHIVSITADYLSANALKDLSGRWQSAASALEVSADNWNKTYKDVSVSADKWNTTYERVELSGDEWDKVSAKLDSATFTAYSALMEQKLTDLDDKNLDTSAFTAWSAQTTDWDVSAYSAGEGIGIDEHKISITADYLSANALKDLSGKWENAADALNASADIWNKTTNDFNTSSKIWNKTTNDFNTSSTLWNQTKEEFDVSSKLWNETKNRVDLSGDVWDTVIDKLDKEDFNTWSAKTTDWDVSAYSGVSPISIEQHKVSIDLSEYYKKTETSGSDELYTKFGEIENRFEPIETDVATLKEYSAHNVVESSNQYIDVQFGTNKFTLTFTSGDLATKTWTETQLANFGGFEIVDELPQTGDNKKIYLIEISGSPDRYREWIVTTVGSTTAWTCIGDTSVDLTQYYKKTETSSRQEISTEFTNTSAWANDTFQPIGNYVTSGNYITPGSAWVLVNDDNNIQWSGLDVSELGKKYIVKSTNGSVKVGSATVGNVVTYDLSADNMPTISSEYMLSNYNSATNKYELSGATIVGENGISAEYNPATNEWNVGLEEYNNIGFAKYSTSSNVYSTSAVVDGYTEDLNVNPTKIILDNDKILLKTGFYHVDVQTNFTIANPDNNYYNVFVKSIPNAASITQMIDGSYAHTETVDLSFDIRITNDDTPLEISVEYFKTNETFAISNLNIHEIVSMPSQIEGGAGDYQAGNGISIGNDTIAAKIGNGLEFNESNAIQVKLGEGLAFTDDQGIKAISIDPAGEVAEVVKDVEALQDELDTKITDNFPPAMITLANLQVATGTQYAPSNGGMLIGYLFTCPITHNIYVNNEKYQTKIGIYTKQWSGDNKKVILGIYEYDPDYNEGGQVGRTVALCDTGIIDLQQGYAEYEIKNVGKDTTPIMTPGKFYYATIYLSYKAGDTNGITLFGAPGYNTQVNNLKPGITITNVNCIHASLYEGLDGYSPNLNFDQMGFSWQYNSYPPDPDTQDSSQDLVEAHAAGRPYFAIRNVKITGN